MHPLVARVRRTIRRHALIPRGAPVMVAVSGGADSVALAHVLAELAAAGDVDLVGLAHLNHRLRGAGAEADEQFCRELAVHLARPIVADAIDVRRLASAEGRSIEEAAREARYRFLEHAADRLGAAWIAVAHTTNDQAETVLLRLFRGTGTDGLASIRRRRGRVVRPLLDETRETILEYLCDRSIPFREDETNRDVSNPRNRIRHELIPHLEDRFAPEVVPHLARTAALAADDAELLNELADSRAADILSFASGRVAIDLVALRREPAAIGSRLLRRAFRHVAGERFAGFGEVDRLRAMAAPDGPALADLPGARVERLGDRLVLSSHAAGERAVLEPWTTFRYVLSIPGEVVVAEAGCRIEAERLAGSSGTRAEVPLESRGGVAIIDAAGLSDTLSVRGRRRGDSFRPLGLEGRKKLQDFFVDRKVPRARRDRVPIVVDALDRIVWVAGHAIAEEFRVTDLTQSMVILRLRDLGGHA
jgi:tRNA(Ile)-lysidine synthase